MDAAKLLITAPVGKKPHTIGHTHTTDRTIMIKRRLAGGKHHWDDVKLPLYKILFIHEAVNRKFRK